MYKMFNNLTLDCGQANIENDDYVDPEEPLDDHLTRPNVEYPQSDVEVNEHYDDHYENNDHITIGPTDQPDPQTESFSVIGVQSYDDHITNEMEFVDHNLNDELDEQHFPELHNDQEYSDLDSDLSNYEIEDRIVRYAMQRREEI
ncbi:uncharacterized protein LOC127010866 isoform X2 [Drosophila biarmipes]|uniref:uncharacterized protein LOC127010866 isoform X2 n=1 Tax=Drosophila biarmipes TaxID=125945 RepID=UPI0021CCB856|nr:uncharacterized protein LOC127010866 isoform X2 [Drosophila biarmipes]